MKLKTSEIVTHADSGIISATLYQDRYLSVLTAGQQFKFNHNEQLAERNRAVRFRRNTCKIGKKL